MPKVSVIMPVHNEPEMYLRAAINSILKQTYKDFEFIIINDASENNAEEVILSYKDSRIIYYKNRKNLKVIKTLNKGLKLAKGEYIARMDADDIAFKNRLEKQVEVLDKNSRIGGVNAYCYFFPNKRPIVPPLESNDIDVFLKYCGNCILHPVVMIRKSVIDNNNLKYSNKFLHVEDYKLWIDMCDYTKFVTIPEFLLLHREWSSSVSKQNAWEQYYNAKIVSFEAMLKDLNIRDKSLEKIFVKQLKQKTLSKDEFIKLDKVYTLAIANVYKKSNPVWHHYMINSLNNYRNDIFKKIDWSIL